MKCKLLNCRIVWRKKLHKRLEASIECKHWIRDSIKSAKLRTFSKFEQIFKEVWDNFDAFSARNFPPDVEMWISFGSLNSRLRLDKIICPVKTTNMSSSLKTEYKSAVQQDIAESATGIMKRPNNISHYQRIFQVCVCNWNLVLSLKYLMGNSVGLSSSKLLWLIMPMLLKPWK